MHLHIHMHLHLHSHIHLHIHIQIHIYKYALHLHIHIHIHIYKYASIRTDCRLSVYCVFMMVSGSLRDEITVFFHGFYFQSCTLEWDSQYKTSFLWFRLSETIGWYQFQCPKMGQFLKRFSFRHSETQAFTALFFTPSCSASSRSRPTHLCCDEHSAIAMLECMS